MGYSDLRKRSADEGREAGVDDPAVGGDEAPHPPERGDRRGPASLGAAAAIPGLLAVLEAPPAAPGQHVPQPLDELPGDDAAPAEAAELAADSRGRADPRRPERPTLLWRPERHPPRGQGQRQRGTAGCHGEEHRRWRRHFAPPRSGFRFALAAGAPPGSNSEGRSGGASRRS
uniref:ATTAP1 n=1 Tax=Arundo donax TaxID=35708 RepID=A0A0A9H9I2_ARUDO